MRGGEGGEERRVDFRDLEAEWTPVRHKPKSFTLGRRLDNRRRNTISNKWLNVWNPSKECVTFFFTNFPDSCNTSILNRRFNEIAVVTDLFIPSRMDKNGKTYGFVRFSGKINTPQVEGELNNIWFGSYKLRANLSKFARKEPKIGREVNGSHAKGPYGIGNLGAARTESKSYLQAMCSKDVRITNKVFPKEQKGEFEGISYNSSEEDRELLSRCFSGQLKMDFNWPDVQGDIQVASEGRFIVKYRGGDMVLIFPHEDREINSDDLGVLIKWFEFLEPWSEKDIHNIRLVWSLWYGIPMHAWNKKFFRLVSLKFGKMIKVDESTTNKSNVHRARILIRTSRPEIPRGSIPVWVDGRKFILRIREEGDWDEDPIAEWSDGGILDSDDEHCDWWRSEADTEEDQELTGVQPEMPPDKEDSLEESKVVKDPTAEVLGSGAVANIINVESTSVLAFVEDRDNGNTVSSSKESGPRISESIPPTVKSQESILYHTSSTLILPPGPSMGLKSQISELSLGPLSTEPIPGSKSFVEPVLELLTMEKSNDTSIAHPTQKSLAKVISTPSSESFMDTETSVSENSMEARGLEIDTVSSAVEPHSKPRPPMSWQKAARKKKKQQVLKPGFEESR
ncbi:hypothetical protein ACS0TY_006222 [Phlomoides rotata]